MNEQVMEDGARYRAATDESVGTIPRPGATTARASAAATPTIGLLRGLLDDATQLLSTELKLARAEIGRSIDQAKAGAGSMAAGGAIALAGLVVLLIGAGHWVAMYLPLWGALLAVGAVTIVVGLILLAAGKKRISAESFVPERTIAAVQDDRDMVKGRL